MTDYSNHLENTRRLEYLNLNIPETTHELTKDGIGIRCCNFKKDKATKHIYHNRSATDVGQQLNTVVDLIINLSENLHGADKGMIKLIKDLGKKGTTEVPLKLIEQINTIHKNQDYLEAQLKVIKERLDKTLNKADKFPSKKDIRALTEEIKEVVKVPNSVEQKILDLTTRQDQMLQTQISNDEIQMKRILGAIDHLRKTFLGEPVDDYSIE